MLCMVAASLVPVQGPVWAATIMVEAEDFVDFYESGQYDLIHEYLNRLEGLDYPGEWTEYDMHVPAFGTYSIVLLCWGDYNVPYHLRLHVTPALGGDAQTIDIEFLGKGCFG
jgi:hypothetical protein